MTTYTDSLIITETMRRYNAKTSRYESVVTKKPDPWEGAPRGIRVISRLNGSFWVYECMDKPIHRRYKGNSSNPWEIWCNLSSHTLQKEVNLLLEGGCAFPDFDGAPEGQRFYANWVYVISDGTGWEPRVAADGVVYHKSRGVWMIVNNARVKGIDWYQKSTSWDVILVDPTPEEPKPVVHHTTKVDTVINHVVAGEVTRNWANGAGVLLHDQKIQEGDVIHDLGSGNFWYVRSNGYWSIGPGNPSLPTIVRSENWVMPQSFRIVSRAVN